MWALTDSTSENGSTLLVPGSHCSPDERRPGHAEAIALAFPAGSVPIWLGGTFHGGGPDTTQGCRSGISIIDFQRWLRQIEGMTLAVPTAVAARYAETVQRLLG